MREIIKDSLKILKNNFILVSSIIFILITVEIILLNCIIKQNLNISLLVIVGLFVALYSGWLNMIKKSITEYNKTNYTQTFEYKPLLSEFFTGVGEKFFQVLKIFLLFIFTLMVTYICFYKLLINVHPALYLSANDLTSIYQTLIETKTYTTDLFTGKVLIFLCWTALYCILFGIYSYIYIYILAVTYMDKEKKISLILKKSLIFIYNNAFYFLCFLIFFTFIYLVSAMIFNMLKPNILFQIISILFVGYFITFYNIVVFLFYERKNQSNGNNRSDSNR